MCIYKSWNNEIITIISNLTICIGWWNTFTTIYNYTIYGNNIAMLNGYKF